MTDIDEIRRGAIAKYIARPYHFVLVWDEESLTWSGSVKEFPGCFAQGDSLNIIGRLDEAAQDWIAAALDLGQEIPEPEEK